jgi:antitoxin YefM
MDAISYTSARNNLAKTMDQVCDDHTPVIITRQNARPVVIMSLEDFQAIEETAYLLRSGANAARLAESIAQANAGKIVAKDLIGE